MRKRDLELIAALAEGTLEDESEARALLDSSPAHRAEYEAQRTALEALRSVPGAAMTPHEKAALRRDVWASLRSQPPVTQKRVPWLLRWSFAGATVLVLGVGLIAVLNQSGDDTTDVVSFDATSQDLAESAPAAADGAADEEATETSVAADSGGVAAMEPDSLVLYFRDRADVARHEGIPGLTTPGTDLETLTEEQTDCLEQAGLQDYQLIARLTGSDAAEANLELATSYLMMIPPGETLGPTTPVSFVDTTTCEVVHTEE